MVKQIDPSVRTTFANPHKPIHELIKIKVIKTKDFSQVLEETIINNYSKVSKL